MTSNGSAVILGLRLIFAMVLGATCSTASAQSSPSTPPSMACQVLDRELQVSYQGGCVNGLAQGRGVARGAYGAYYEGEFLAGAKSGQGTKLYFNGDAYTGSWLADARNGFGTYVYGENSPFRGDVTHSEWVSDKLHGKGVYIFGPDNIRFDTEFYAGAPLGFAPPAVVQRQRAMKVLVPVIGKAGASVCSVTTQGASPKHIAYGTVTQVLEERLQVRIDTDYVIQASASKTNPRWDSITDWMPCQKP